jgi:hypothetical protein
MYGLLSSLYFSRTRITNQPRLGFRDSRAQFVTYDDDVGGGESSTMKLVARRRLTQAAEREMVAIYIANGSVGSRCGIVSVRNYYTEG